MTNHLFGNDEFSIFVTIKNGKEAKVIGNLDAIERIVSVLEAADFKFNEKIETYDEGFYAVDPEAV